MYVPSNTSTMKINFLKILVCLAFMLSLHSANIHAQEGEPYVIRPLKSSVRHPFLFDVYVYGSGSYKSHGNLWTASNYLYGTKHVYDTFADIGIEAETYNVSWLKFGASLGYKYERYAYNGGFSTSEGVFSHWLSIDLNTSVHMGGFFTKAGIVSDLFLSSKMKSSDSFSYEGLNSGCFNNASFALYFGMGFTVNRVKIEGRIGHYFVPQLNPNKIAYYNLNKSYVSGLYWEARIAYRIFTSGKHYNSSDRLE